MGEPVKTSAPGGAVEASSQAAPAAAGLPVQAESLEAQAARLAESHAAVRRGVFLPPLTRDLKAYRDLMVQAIRRFRGAGEQELALSYAAEWVLDNDYIVQQALRQVAEDLPAKFSRQLPKLAGGPLAGQPRVYALARWLIEAETAHLDLDRVTQFLHAYQSVTPLTMGELWALPIMFRLGIIQCLVAAVAHLTGLEAGHILMFELAPNAESGSAADGEVVANSFFSLRAIAAQDWKVFFEELSLVEQVLNQDPGGFFAEMNFETRDRYRKVVEELSLETGLDELEIARQAIHLARQAPPSPPRRVHVGYYLVDRGRQDLDRALGRPLPGSKRLALWAMAHPTGVYLGSILLLVGVLVAFLAGYTLLEGGAPLTAVLAALLGLVPAFTVAVSLVNWVVTKTVKPRVLPKMDYDEGLPEDCVTLVAVPALLTNPEEAHSLLQQLEQHYIRNADPRLFFALLTDFSDADQQHLPTDGALLQQVKQGVQTLNNRYGDRGRLPFYLFHRERQWNPGEKTWMGWERKRGKLHELNQLVLNARQGHLPKLEADDPTGRAGFALIEGDLPALAQLRYVITLDADTILPRDTARQLVAALSHPLNQAELDPRTGAVLAGYNILQPRTEINPVRAHRSWFTRIFSGDTGLDLYTLAVSDVYQDFFGEGIYVGKGIYDIAAFESSLAGRIPQNSLLSHDLFEGIHGRVGLVSDIVLIEDYPAVFLTHMRRLHRWVRGDWQLFPWLLPRVPGDQNNLLPNRLSLINRWKIADNLRRSLVAPVLLLWLAAGWLWLPGLPWLWEFAAAFTLGVPFLTASISALGEVFAGKASRQTLYALRDSALRWALALVFLPYEALLDLNAISRTLVRLLITRQQMLRWTTAAQTAHRMGREPSPAYTWREMAPSVGLALLLAVILALVRPASLLAAAPFLIAWIIAPEIAYRISRPIYAKAAPLDSAQLRRLRRLARRTWAFFEQYIGPEDQWLPPDHYQESPLGSVAHHTSPTNIGLALLSGLAAYDLGYVGLLNLVARTRNTFDTLEKLERYRGHFLNWYDTRSLEPLTPRYISTVDSGNLAACLIALGEGFQGVPTKAILRWETLQGVLDIFDLLAELVENLTGVETRPAAARLKESLAHMSQEISEARLAPSSWAAILTHLSGPDWDEVNQALIALVEAGSADLGVETLHQVRVYARQARTRLDNAHRELELLQPWLLDFQHPPELFNRPDLPAVVQAAWQALQAGLPALVELDRLAEVAQTGGELLTGLQDALGAAGLPPDQTQAACDWAAALAGRLNTAGMTAKTLEIGFGELYRQAETFVQAMDFTFLFDLHREVFHIGYNLALEKLDANFYDLLASEARIASLIAIAKGDVPQSHWLHLARPLTSFDGTPVLLSWSATMFEYLMPLLLVRSYPGTLLDQTVHAATDLQIAYGREKKVPWGVSESGYYRFDANNVYQYRAFGVPGLGYKRGLGDDLVTAPYASLLALPLRPQAVLENMAALDRRQALGAFGYYEAVDFTPARLPLGNSYEVVREYMAHHQGMILISLANHFSSISMVQRFHADPRIRSVELLLQEQIPYNAPLENPHADDAPAIRPARPRSVTIPWRARVQTLQPRVHFLSNGHLGTLITASGAGYSTWNEVDLTRWRADTTLNEWGSWLYIQDVESGELWSAGFQPTVVQPRSRDVFFNAHLAEFRRQDQDISTVMEVTVAPEEDVEVRRVSISNLGTRPRRLRLVTYGEVVLAAQAADARHPAFNKLFIESEWIGEQNALLFRRRPRSDDELPVYLVHAAIVEAGQAGACTYETNRAVFVGRGRTSRRPAALDEGRPLANTTGATLDPLFSISQEIELEAHGSARVAFLTLAAGTRADALALAGRYRPSHVIERAFEQARFSAEAELRQLGLTTAQVERIDRLLSLLLYPHAALRARPEVLAANTRGQPGLWGFSISGDYPILLVRISDPEQLPLVHELLQAHAYWRNRQLKIDLVLLNSQGTDYGQELNSQIYRLLARSGADAWLNRRGGIFLLFIDRLSQDEQILLQTVARVILDGGQGSLADQVARIGQLPARLPPFVPARTAEAETTPPVSRPADLRFDNGLGGFSPDGREYVIYLEPGQTTPAPWINVIANPDFGFLVSEAGSGYTWALNSGENRLTPWSNDPVSDPSGEALYLRDEETAEVWSPTPLPSPAGAPYLVRHGAGYSIFEHASHGLKLRLRLFAPADAPLKIVQLRLENTLDRARRITATYYVEWVLGVTREAAQQYVVPEFDGESQALLARNPYYPEFGERVAFAAANKTLHGLTADRTEFLGRMGSRAQPAALGRIGLASSVAAGLDPCAALQLHIDLPPGGTEEIYFLLGQESGRAEAVALVHRFQDPAQVEAAWQALNAHWDSLLNTVTVQTPDPAMDLLLNRWLLYQTLSCRLWGRSAFYQSSGAYGFRDQLQDVLALVFAAPQLARQHILLAAGRQFEAGDVLHWWHPPSGRGVRTRISDDLLWLPYVTAQYIAATGDTGILNEPVPFLQGPVLDPKQLESYAQYLPGSEAGTLYEHCRRALEKGATSGPHKLPLMGTGDWNDGMNRVGVEGRGESVWLGWFLIATLESFAAVCEQNEKPEQAAAFRERAAAYRQALEASAWDGAWYLRAFYDDGTPLGSAQDRECQIDSIAQSWAVLSGADDPPRSLQAMQSVSNRLVRPGPGLLLLFTPPFDRTLRDPGYIKGYLPGTRENGGQYTHAALWSVWAFANLGQGDTAGSLFRLLSPVYHADSPEKAARYKVEPYVVAADVYGVAPHTGRGGWTWYSGSAGWMYRLGVEALLGLRRAGAALVLDPCIPRSWPGYDLTYRYGETVYHIRVENPNGVSRGVRQVTLDGADLPDGKILLAGDGGAHQVRVVLGIKE